jgi:DNA-binding HxlR family transcriptional regulator
VTTPASGAIDDVSSREAPDPPAVPLASCPINASLGTLGRKWTLLILRDIAFAPGAGFATIRRNCPGLGNRTLSIRLRQLVRDDIIERVEAESPRGAPGYRLTAKGRDVMPILTAFLQYGSRHFSTQVFADGRPRSLAEVYPTGRDFMVGRLAAYVRGEDGPVPPRPRGRQA